MGGGSLGIFFSGKLNLIFFMRARAASTLLPLPSAGLNLGLLRRFFCFLKDRKKEGGFPARSKRPKANFLNKNLRKNLIHYAKFRKFE
jgi:hypothetical protein